MNQSDITRELESVPSSSLVKYDDRIKVAVTEADHSKREARFERSKREEAEISAVDALKRVYNKFL